MKNPKKGAYIVLSMYIAILRIRLKELGANIGQFLFQHMDSLTSDTKLPPQLVSVTAGDGWCPFSIVGPGRYPVRCSDSNASEIPRNVGTAELGPLDTLTATYDTGNTTGNSFMDNDSEISLNSGRERDQQQPSQDPVAETAARKTQPSNEVTHKIINNTKSRNIEKNILTEPINDHVKSNNTKKDSIQSNQITSIPKTNKRHKNRYVPVTMEELFAPLKWPRYVSVNFPEGSSFSGLQTDIFLSDFLQVPAPYFKIERSCIIVKAPTKDLSHKLMNLENLNGIPVTTTDRNCFNQREGTIRVDLLKASPNDTNSDIALAIKKMLQNRHHNVESVDIYERPNKVKSKNLKFAKITFNQQSIPDEIHFSNTRIPIQEVFPNPMLCSKCLIYGHTIKKCKAVIHRCFNCSSSDHTRTNCLLPPKCNNCRGNHQSFNRSCPHFIYRQEVLIRMKRYGISWKQAMGDMRSEGHSLDTRSWSNVVSSTPKSTSPDVHIENQIKTSTSQNLNVGYQPAYNSKIPTIQNQNSVAKPDNLQLSNKFTILSDKDITSSGSEDENSLNYETVIQINPPKRRKRKSLHRRDSMESKTSSSHAFEPSFPIANENNPTVPNYTTSHHTNHKIGAP